MLTRIIHILLRKKARFFITPFLIVSMFFILYQLIIFTQLTKRNKDKHEGGIWIRGTHARQRVFYEPNEKHQFTCIHSMEIIDFDRVNDDYCDCLDGSDEPGTNACANSLFFCTVQDSSRYFHKSISSSRVNDGICDCCDGSDEWKDVKLPFALSNNVQRSIHRHLSPCSNLCT